MQGNSSTRTCLYSGQWSDEKISCSILFFVLVVSISGSVLASVVVAFFVYKRRKDINVFCFWYVGTRLPFLRKQKPMEEKFFDAFVSYSSDNRDFALRIILHLEEHDPPYRVCNPQIDFEPGKNIGLSIEETVTKCRVFFLILSNDFLESEWCQLEFEVAEVQMAEDKDFKIVGERM